MFVSDICIHNTEMFIFWMKQVVTDMIFWGVMPTVGEVNRLKHTGYLSLVNTYQLLHS